MAAAHRGRESPPYGRSGRAGKGFIAVCACLDKLDLSSSTDNQLYSTGDAIPRAGQKNARENGNAYFVGRAGKNLLRRMTIIILLSVTKIIRPKF